MGGVSSAAPDDGRPALDEASRPTGPQPTADTRDAVAAGRHLIEVHDYLHADLARVRETLRQVAAGEAEIGAARGQPADVTRRANAWTLGGLCQGYCRILAHHHSLESEGIFPYLRSRQADLGAVLDRLHEEHEVIHWLLEDVDAALVRLAADPTDLGPVTDAVDQLTETLLPHFAYEERELVASLARYGFF